MKVVVDADVIIDHLRRRGTENTLYNRLVELQEQLVMSLVTVAEVYSGKSAQVGGNQREILEEMMGGIEIITPALETAKSVGKLKSEYNHLLLGDAFVAVLALELSLPLATFNVREFRKVKSLILYPLPHEPATS